MAGTSVVVVALEKVTQAGIHSFHSSDHFDVYLVQVDIQKLRFRVTYCHRARFVAFYMAGA